MKSWANKFRHNLARFTKYLLLSFIVATITSVIWAVWHPEEHHYWLIERLIRFFQIWSFEQWFFSLALLIPSYFLMGHVFNKWLEKTLRGQWLTMKDRAWLILFDFTLNLSLGLYYMDYRDKLMGEIMMRCPIAISPLIFMGELIFVTIYYFYIAEPLSPRGIIFWQKMDQKPYWIWLKKWSTNLYNKFKT